MTYETFETLIKNLTDIRERSHNIYEIGVNLLDYEEIYHTVITALLKEVFGEEGWDWISWYLYEKEGFDGKVLQAYDENDNEICHNVKSLWETIQKPQP